MNLSEGARVLALYLGMVRDVLLIITILAFLVVGIDVTNKEKKDK